MIERFLSTEFILETLSSILITLDPPTASNSVSLSFSSNNVGVRLNGFSDGTGTVYLQGNVGETLTFPANGELFSLIEFTSLTSIITSGLVNETTVGKIDIFLTTSAGSPVETRIQEGTYKGRISNRKRSFRDIQAGLEIETAPILFTTFNVPIKVKDYVRAVGRTFSVENITFPGDLQGNINHLECELREIPGE